MSPVESTAHKMFTKIYVGNAGGVLLWKGELQAIPRYTDNLELHDQVFVVSEVRWLIEKAEVHVYVN